MSEESEKYYLAPDQVKSIAVRKKGWSQPFAIRLETVEISPRICCFESEDEILFTIGDELDFSFDIGGDGLFQARAVIQQIDRTEFLDELYDQKPMFCCCAQFNDALTREIFEQIAGTRLMTQSLV